MASPPVSNTSSSSSGDPCIKATLDMINWDKLSSLACALAQLPEASCHWGDQLSGGYNLVRFLHLHDAQNTVIVARVPLRSEEAMSEEHDSAISKRIESEVVTMKYVETRTTIPVPHMLHYSAHTEENVRSPYILMSKVDGIPLASVWEDMDDVRRHIVLQQVIDILLELWSHRFDKKGALFNDADGSLGIHSSTLLEDPDDIGTRHCLQTTSYSHAADYWLAYANANLHDIDESLFGSDLKPYDYAMAWFMRSLVPALFDTSIDVHGCPLAPGDFHSQNIMITDPKSSHPYHPAWDEDHPLRERNIRDQATFDELLLEAERNRNPVGGSQLSHLISNSYGIYLFQQVMYYPALRSVFYPLLWAHVFGNEPEENFSDDYYFALENGILCKDWQRFDRETEVWLEACHVLGEEVGSTTPSLTRKEFKDLVVKYLDRFNEEGSVRRWLACSQ
ncbi:hypothetical protein BT96DRAFT_1021270 [Gymnopus androsaceus JB14]|uniref:Aminoglycoside phosphotransferase domain-containing protein n=1 Tax=Gymnopus androsaceus JB14 TaxID=1447944 RepID=A0A6A4HDW0_9AGAR|nr:hypothetical protein BT96DRAFT_1021270 [Gymnopus androsaceus JB14]